MTILNFLQSKISILDKQSPLLISSRVLIGALGWHAKSDSIALLLFITKLVVKLQNVVDHSANKSGAPASSNWYLLMYFQFFAANMSQTAFNLDF